MASDLNIINYLEAGLRAEGLRQKTIANNVANMNAPGFKRSDIRFEELLRKAIDSGKNFDPSETQPEVYQPNSTPVDGSGNDVSLDSEVGQMVKNSLRHKAFVLLLKKKYQQFDAAIRTQ